MKFVCFGYYDEKKWETMSESEQNTLMDECLLMTMCFEKRAIRWETCFWLLSRAPNPSLHGHGWAPAMLPCQRRHPQVA